MDRPQPGPRHHDIFSSAHGHLNVNTVRHQTVNTFNLTHDHISLRNKIDEPKQHRVMP